MDRIECGISADRKQARVAGRWMEPVEVENLIWQLVACRQAMAPKRFPVMFEGSRIVLGDALERTADGMVAVHHPALGWVGARIELKITDATHVSQRAQTDRCRGANRGG